MATTKTPKPKSKKAPRPKEPKVMGRPTIMTPDLEDEMLALISTGISVYKMCRMEGMPDRVTFWRHMRRSEDFRNRYELAVEQGAHAIADESLEIADEIAGNPVLVDGVPLVQNGKIVTIVDSASVAHAKLKIDTRKWFTSKICPKFGDKVDVTSGGQAIKSVWHVHPVKPKEDEGRDS